ncbi:MAG TPA: cytochrome c biogenesis protein ResB [Bacteroidales bacterium]|nr:cytochrome c biogenesis protein ResB [Bacteroidales bacterium]
MEEQGQAPASKRKFGQFPWNYREGISIAAGLMALGFIIEFATGSKGVSIPAWPTNLFILLLFVGYVLAFQILVKHPVKKWLSSTPAAITAITAFAFLTLLMGFIPQSDKNTFDFISKAGLTHITRSWPFMLCSFNLLLILSFTIIRRILPFSIKNVAFTLNHLGLWIVIVAASLGSSDSIKLNMMLTENKVTNVAFDDYGQAFETNINLKLLKFSIDEYPPQLGLIDARTNKLVSGKKDLLEVKKDYKAIMGDWTVSIIDFIENAQKDSSGFSPSAAYGSAPAALVSTFNNKTKETDTGWVSSGSPMVYPKNLDLQDNKAIAMTIRKPKKFASEIRAYGKTTDYEDFTVEVNKPARFNGWTIYQSGYDEPMGKWSKRSVVQLVRDPWLPVVYTGLFMIMAGALYLFWHGRSKNTTKKITI